MYLLYDKNTLSVINIIDSIRTTEDEIIAQRGRIFIKYPKENIKIAISPNDSISYEEGMQLIYDLESETVMSIPTNPSHENQDLLQEEVTERPHPMTITEMRSRITELEGEFTVIRTLLEEKNIVLPQTEQSRGGAE